MKIFLAFLSLIVVYSSTSCKEKPELVTTHSQDLKSPEEQKADQIESKAIGDFIEKLILAGKEGDTDFIEKSFDVKAFTDKGVSEMELSEELVEEFSKYSKESFKNKVGGILYRAFDKGEFSYLGRVSMEGELLPVVRKIGDGGFNYTFLKLQKEGRSYDVIDLFPLLMGEWMSKSYQRLIMPSLISNEPDFFESTEGVVMLGNYEAMSSFFREVREEKYDMAILDYRMMSKNFAKQRLVWAAYINCLLYSENENYLSEIEKFNKAFPNDLSMSFTAMYAAISDENWELALEKIDLVDQGIGGDPFLDLMRSSVEHSRGNILKAMEYCRDVIIVDPNIEHSYWSLVALSTSQNDFATMRENLTILRDKFDIKFDEKEMKANPIYAEFCKSADAKEFFGD